jgi:hypothetical protein
LRDETEIARPGQRIRSTCRSKADCSAAGVSVSASGRGRGIGIWRPAMASLGRLRGNGTNSAG